MATRKATAARRAALVDDISRACRDGGLRPGDMLPTMRELQDKYQLSSRIVSAELRRLADEGVLRTEPRVGVFVADHVVEEPDTYLMVVPTHPEARVVPQKLERVRDGFEERVTQLGGASMCIAIDLPRVGEFAAPLPPVAGVFAAAAGDVGELHSVVPDSVPRVRWNTFPVDRTSQDAVVDTIAPDHVDAGRQAAMHLWRRGHRRIGFLGLHTAAGPSPLPMYHWSALLEQGWRSVLEDAGVQAANMLFLPDVPTSRDHEGDTAAEVSRTIVARRDVSAVVCANGNAADGLIHVLREVGVPPDAWPALVVIDGAGALANELVTTLRLPLEDLGRMAAQLLWERAHNRLAGPAQHHLVPLALVRRADTGNAWVEHVHG